MEPIHNKTAIWLTAGGLLVAVLAIIGFGTIGMPGGGGIHNPFVAACATIAYAAFVTLMFPLGLLGAPLRLPATLPVMGAIILVDATIWVLLFWGVIRFVRRIRCQQRRP